MTSVVLAPWKYDWLWSIPLIVVTIVFHSFALGLLSRGLRTLLKDERDKPVTRALSISVVGGSSLCTICLHGLEAWMWSIAYHLLGTLGTVGGDRKDAMLYSISVMTTVGGTPLHLEPKLGDHGTARGIRRVDSVRAYRRFPIRSHPESLVAGAFIASFHSVG